MLGTRFCILNDLNAFGNNHVNEISNLCEIYAIEVCARSHRNSNFVAREDDSL